MRNACSVLVDDARGDAIRKKNKSRLMINGDYDGSNNAKEFSAFLGVSFINGIVQICIAKD